MELIWRSLGARALGACVVMKTHRRLLIAHDRELNMTRADVQSSTYAGQTLAESRPARSRGGKPAAVGPSACPTAWQPSSAGETVAWTDESGPVPAGPTGVAEEKEEAPAVPETLKKKRRNFPKLKIKCPREKFAPSDASEGQAGASL